MKPRTTVEETIRSNKRPMTSKLYRKAPVSSLMYLLSLTCSCRKRLKGRRHVYNLPPGRTAYVLHISSPRYINIAAINNRRYETENAHSCRPDTLSEV